MQDYDDLVAALSAPRPSWRQALPALLRCVLRGHRWGDPIAVVICGPMTAHPDDREYRCVGFMQECAVCWSCRDAGGRVDPGMVQDAIAERRMDDLEVWDDPVLRAELLAWCEEQMEKHRVDLWEPEP